MSTDQVWQFIYSPRCCHADDASVPCIVATPEQRANNRLRTCSGNHHHYRLLLISKSQSISEIWYTYAFWSFSIADVCTSMQQSGVSCSFYLDCPSSLPVSVSFSLLALFCHIYIAKESAFDHILWRPMKGVKCPMDVVCGSQYILG